MGLAVARGTGPEVADAFTEVLARLGERHDTPIPVTRSPRAYHTYHSLLADPDPARVRALTLDDAEHYERFCRSLAASGSTAMFRTAMNAQSLYLVRERLRAVKVDAVAPDLLVVRDQAQGFYTGDNVHRDGIVSRTTVFRRDRTEEVVAHALACARRQWPDGGPDTVLMAYKFHLLDGALTAWVDEIAARHGLAIRLCQPDTVNRDLIEHGLRGRTLVIAGNEWGDIMHVVLLDRFADERQESRHTENALLHPDVRDLVEFQTVHGSADDIAGLGVVNPTAAVRAAAAVAERHAGCAGAITDVERALGALAEDGVRTPDRGGSHTTAQVVAALIAALPEPAGAPRG